MTDPSQARIDAALRLAGAVDTYEGTPKRDRGHQEEYEQALSAYRATLPKLRNRAEVDAEIVLLSRQYYAGIGGTQGGLGAVYERLKAACAEPTAPEPAPEMETDPEPCGCEQAEALKATAERLEGYLRDIKFLHRQWSDEKGLAGSILTQIGNVVLRWMSNLP